MNEERQHIVIVLQIQQGETHIYLQLSELWLNLQLRMSMIDSYS